MFAIGGFLQHRKPKLSSHGKVLLDRVGPAPEEVGSFPFKIEDRHVAFAGRPFQFQFHQACRRRDGGRTEFGAIRAHNRLLFEKEQNGKPAEDQA